MIFSLFIAVQLLTALRVNSLSAGLFWEVP